MSGAIDWQERWVYPRTRGATGLTLLLLVLALGLSPHTRGNQIRKELPAP